MAPVSKIPGPSATRRQFKGSTTDEFAAGSARPRRRTLSNASASSTASRQFEDQFVFSPHLSPSHEQQTSFFPPTAPNQGPNYPPVGVTKPSFGDLLQASRTNPNDDSTKPAYTNTAPTPCAKPITIELPPPPSRKIASSSVYTPIEPLSGRGDISGGYFPFHEDPDKRIHHPHPFHAAAQAAKRSAESWQEAPRDIERTTTAAAATRQRPSIAEYAVSEPQGHLPMTHSAKMPSSQDTTPITSYVPSGLHDVPMPIGKYYPTNYEAAQSRKSSSHKTQTSASRSALRPPSVGGSGAIKSDTAVPHFINRTDSRGRSDSDARRRLQQYQRDMVAQATQAARQLASAKTASVNLAAVHGAPMQKFQTGSHRPISPRLQPLGSPGPVTPMELEGQSGDGGYLTRGRPVRSPDAERESHAIARAMRAEDERKRREGRNSPAVEAGGFVF